MHLCLSVYVYVFSIKNDDKMIQAEGLESLSEHELRQACRERGHLGLLSTEEMRLEVCSVLLAHAMFFFSIRHPHHYIRFQILFVMYKRKFAKSGIQSKVCSVLVSQFLWDCLFLFLYNTHRVLKYIRLLNK